MSTKSILSITASKVRHLAAAALALCAAGAAGIATGTAPAPALVPAARAAALDISPEFSTEVAAPATDADCTGVTYPFYTTVAAAAAISVDAAGSAYPVENSAVVAASAVAVDVTTVDVLAALFDASGATPKKEDQLSALVPAGSGVFADAATREDVASYTPTGTIPLAWDLDWNLTAGDAAYATIVLISDSGAEETLLTTTAGIREGIFSWNSDTRTGQVYFLKLNFYDAAGKPLSSLEGPPSDSPIISGTLAADTTLIGGLVYIVEDDVIVPSGVTLTIQPGAIVKFATRKGITVEAGGTLNAKGTNDKKIIFTSIKDDAHGGDTNEDEFGSAPGVGDYKELAISGAGNFSYCEFYYGGDDMDSGSGGNAGTITYKSGSTGSISSCLIQDSKFEGVISYASDLQIHNTIIAFCGRAVNSFGGSTTLKNCTLYSFSDSLVALSHGGALNLYNCIFTNCLHSSASFFYGSPTVQNCIFWNPPEYKTQSVSYAGSNGNVWADPLLRNPEDGDFRLTENSPAVDTANSTTSTETDFTGQLRLNAQETYPANWSGTPAGDGKYADVGAFEYLPANAPSPFDLAIESVSINSLEIEVGAGVMVNWNTVNKGTATTANTWTDVVYLVSEATGVWSEVARKTSTTSTLAPGARVSNLCTFDIPALAPGNYRVCVESNVTQTVFEGINTENNTGKSQIFSVSFPATLLVDNKHEFSVIKASTKGLYITNIPAGAGLLYFRASETNLAFYADSRTVPTASSYEFAPTYIGDGVYILALPANAAPSGLYIIAENKGMFLETVQMEFVAGALQVVGTSKETLSLVDGASLSIYGAGLTGEGISISLTAGGKTISSASKFVASTNELVVKFNLAGESAGSATLVVSDGTNTVSIPNITLAPPAVGAQLEITAEGADFIREERWFTHVFKVTNTGDTDARAPILIINSTSFLFRDVDNGVTEYDGAIRVLALSTNGDPRTIAPGETVEIPIQYKWKAKTSIVPFRAKIYLPDNTYSWDAYWNKDAVTETEWNSFVTLLNARYGSFANFYNELLDYAVAAKTDAFIPRSEELLIEALLQNAELEVNNALGIVTGVLVDSTTQLAKSNYLFQISNAAGTIKSYARTDANGRFSAYGVPRGTLKFITTDGNVVKNAVAGDVVLNTGSLNNVRLFFVKQNGAAAPVAQSLPAGESAAVGTNTIKVKKGCGCGSGDCKGCKEKNNMQTSTCECAKICDTPKNATSCDPNEMQGPAGVGDERFVFAGDWLTFYVFFENKADADVPAQEVIVDATLSEHLDWSTFTLGDIVFDNQLVSSLNGERQGSVTVDHANSDYQVRIQTSIDPDTGEINWYLRSYDPDNAGNNYFPDGVDDGFLPPNDETGRGEGYVSYKVKVKETAPHNARIDSSATIIFDNNDPITTDPAWFNTVYDDDTVPAVPVFTAQPANVKTTIGGTLTLQASADGYGAADGELEFIWFKGDEELATTATGSYTINNAAVADAGSYTVVVRNGFGEVESAPFTVTVEAATPEVSVAVTTPSIAGDAIPVVHEGSELKLTASLENSTAATADGATVSYEWFLSSDGTAGGDDVLVATGAVLSIARFTSVNEGFYYVKATGKKTDGSVIGSDTSEPREVKFTKFDSYALSTKGAKLDPLKVSEPLALPKKFNASADNRGKPVYTWTDADDNPLVIAGKAVKTTAKTVTVKTTGIVKLSVTWTADDATESTTKKFSWDVVATPVLKFHRTEGLLLTAQTTAPADPVKANKPVKNGVVIPTADDTAAGRVETTVFTAKLDTSVLAGDGFTTVPVVYRWYDGGKPLRVTLPTYEASDTLTFASDGSAGNAPDGTPLTLTAKSKISVTVETQARALDSKGKENPSKPLSLAKSKAFAVKAVLPPTVTLNRGVTSVNVTAGKNLTLSAKATGTGSFKYEWFFTPATAGIAEPLPLEGAKASYALKRITTDAAGTYTVRVTGAAGTAYIAEDSIIVEVQ